MISTRGAAKATKVIRVKTPSNRIAPRTTRVPCDGREATRLTSKAVAATRRVSSVFEKGRRRKVKVTGELARRRTAVGEREVVQIR